MQTKHMHIEGKKNEPVIIGRSKNPRCSASSVGFQQKAWISTEREALLFLGNATSHSKVALDSVKLISRSPHIVNL